jgi:hypothetical protein
MALSVAHVDFNGVAPVVRVVVGSALPATFTLGAMPPDGDVTKSIPITTASTAEAVAAPQSIEPVWAQVDEGWIVSVVGGVGRLDGAPAVTVVATIQQDGGVPTPMTMTVSEFGSAAIFFGNVELRS